MSEMRGTFAVTAYTPGQGTAGTEDDWLAYYAPFNCKVVGAKWIPNAAVTADGTNYFILQVLNGSTVVASRSYSATNSVALTAENMTLNATAANLEVDAGETLVIHKETTGLGTGLAMPDGLVVLLLQGN